MRDLFVRDLILLSYSEKKCIYIYLFFPNTDSTFYKLSKTFIIVIIYPESGYFKQNIQSIILPKAEVY